MVFGFITIRFCRLCVFVVCLLIFVFLVPCPKKTLRLACLCLLRLHLMHTMHVCDWDICGVARMGFWVALCASAIATQNAYGMCIIIFIIFKSMCGSAHRFLERWFGLMEVCHNNSAEMHKMYGESTAYTYIVDGVRGRLNKFTNLYWYLMII